MCVSSSALPAFCVGLKMHLAVSLPMSRLGVQRFANVASERGFALTARTGGKVMKNQWNGWTVTSGRPLLDKNLLFIRI